MIPDTLTVVVADPNRTPPRTESATARPKGTAVRRLAAGEPLHTVVAVAR